jgi:ABC-type sugar transport system ATPase subunit
MRTENPFVASFMGSPSMSFIDVTVDRSDTGLSVMVEGGDGRTRALPVPVEQIGQHIESRFAEGYFNRLTGD